jgi:purine-nucleoside/S-methyl-5'-thioadenosine phosphorylase / adenosine deaminase
MVDMMQWPQPSDDFRWVQVEPGPALVCGALEPLADHVFSTRLWALGSGEADEHTAWAEISSRMGVTPARLVRVRQVHGTDVVVRRIGGGHFERPCGAAEAGAADTIISNDPGLALAIQVADCVPLLLADRRTGAVAAAHAGWRGLAAGVPALAVAALAREFDSQASDLVAAAGPSVGACCYEVGTDVYRRFEEAAFSRGQLARWFLPFARPSARNRSFPGLVRDPRPGRWYFDGIASVCDQLEACGLLRANIHVAGLCTASHPEIFCSYRRDGAPAGRMVAAIRCPPRRP